jgi:hypothetical protein
MRSGRVLWREKCEKQVLEGVMKRVGQGVVTSSRSAPRSFALRLGLYKLQRVKGQVPEVHLLLDLDFFFGEGPRWLFNVLRKVRC